LDTIHSLNFGDLKMSDYVLLDDGGDVQTYPYSIALLKKDNPNTSFPASPTDAMMEEWDVYPVNITTETLGADQKRSYASTPSLVDGNWVLAHTAADMLAEEVEARDEVKAYGVREDRDSRLAACDWHGLSDNTMSAEMTVYRQSLRDIPAQAGFPNTITWPDSP